MEKEEFEKQWLYRPVTIKGIFDHDKEVMIQRTVGGNRGYEIITPLFTGIDPKSGQLQGLLVNRGRIPYDYKDSGMHLTPENEEQTIEGIIFYSEGEDKIKVDDQTMKQQFKE